MEAVRLPGLFLAVSFRACPHISAGLRGKMGLLNVQIKRQNRIFAAKFCALFFWTRLYQELQNVRSRPEALCVSRTGRATWYRNCRGGCADDFSLDVYKSRQRQFCCGTAADGTRKVKGGDGAPLFAVWGSVLSGFCFAGRNLFIFVRTHYSINTGRGTGGNEFLRKFSRKFFLFRPGWWYNGGEKEGGVG